MAGNEYIMARPKILKNGKPLSLYLEDEHLKFFERNKINISSTIRDLIKAHMKDVSILEIAEQLKQEVEQLKSDIRQKDKIIQELSLKANKREAVRDRIDEITEQLIEIDREAHEIKFKRKYDLWLQEKANHKTYAKGTTEYEEHLDSLIKRRMNFGLDYDDAKTASIDEIKRHNEGGFAKKEPIMQEFKPIYQNYRERAKLEYQKELDE